MLIVILDVYLQKFGWVLLDHSLRQRKLKGLFHAGVHKFQTGTLKCGSVKALLQFIVAVLINRLIVDSRTILKCSA